MGYVFGYTDANNDMYVIASAGSNDYNHKFPPTWTKIPVKVKQAVISNEDYNSVVDGYIDMNNNLYIWRSDQTPIFVDSNVKQADSSEEGILFYVKNDNTLWAAHVKTSINKKQVASDVEYVVSANFSVAYRSIKGYGYFGVKKNNEDLSVSFNSVGLVNSIAVTGGNGSYRRGMYVNMNNQLLTTSFNYSGTFAASDFSLTATNVKSVKKGGWEYCYLTLDNQLYWVFQGSAPERVATNVADYWTDKTWASNIEAIFYTTLDDPGKLKATKIVGVTANIALSTPTPIVTMGSNYKVNPPPTQPGAITGIKTGDSYLSGESETISWGASTDENGDSIKYQLDFYDGISWINVDSDITATTYKHTFPPASTSEAQYRIKAIDEFGATSEYRYSNIFKVYRGLFLIRDSNGKYKGMSAGKLIEVI